MNNTSDLLKDLYHCDDAAEAALRFAESTARIEQALANQEFVNSVRVAPEVAEKLDDKTGRSGEVWLGTYGAATLCGRETNDYKTDWHNTLEENRRTQRDAAMVSPFGHETPARGNVKHKGLLPVYRLGARPYYAASDLRAWLASANVD